MGGMHKVKIKRYSHFLERYKIEFFGLADVKDGKWDVLCEHGAVFFKNRLTKLPAYGKIDK